MLLGVYRQTKDREWLAGSVEAAEEYYRYWTREPHLTPQTGLSRYFDLGEGPSPEVLASEVNDSGKTHYDLVKDYFRTHRMKDYDESRFYDRKRDQLTPEFYKGDRSMRESGFDPSSRFGPFNADIVDYNPVGLNSLLYMMEKDMAEILEIVGRGAEAGMWRTRAEERAERMNRLLWDARDGLYYDYNFVQKRDPAVSVPDDVLSAVGGNRERGAGGARPESSGEIRTGGRIADQHQQKRGPVGCAVRMGSAGADRRGGLAAIRV